MGNADVGRDFDHIAEKNEVEVEGTGGAGVRPLASVVMLDGQQTLEYLPGWQRRVPYGNRVQVKGLILKPLPFWLGFDVVGNNEIGD